jgi:hypothetical protein
MHRLSIHPLTPEGQPERHDQRKPDRGDINQGYAEADNYVPGLPNISLFLPGGAAA